MEPADLQPLSSYCRCFGALSSDKALVVLWGHSRQEGTAPKGCSLGFVYFLKNRDCFLVKEPVSAPPSAGMSRGISFPRPSLWWDHTQSCCVPLPWHLPCCHPSPEPSALCCCRINTSHSKTHWRTTITGKGDQKDQSHSPGMEHGKLSLPQPLDHRLKPPPADKAATRARTPTCFLSTFISFGTKTPRARQCCWPITITIDHFCIQFSGSGLL